MVMGKARAGEMWLKNLRPIGFIVAKTSRIRGESPISCGRLKRVLEGSIPAHPSSGNTRGTDPLEGPCFGCLRSREVPPKLKIHPEARRVSKELRQP